MPCVLGNVRRDACQDEAGQPSGASTSSLFVSRFINGHGRETPRTDRCVLPLAELCGRGARGGARRFRPRPIATRCLRGSFGCRFGRGAAGDRLRAGVSRKGASRSGRVIQMQALDLPWEQKSEGLRIGALAMSPFDAAALPGRALCTSPGGPVPCDSCPWGRAEVGNRCLSAPECDGCQTDYRAFATKVPCVACVRVVRDGVTGRCACG